VKNRGLFLFKRNEKKNRIDTLTPKMPFAARFSCCAMVVLVSRVKISFSNSSGVHSLVALFQQGAHHLTLSPLFISYCHMMKCLFLTGVCFSIHCPVSKSGAGLRSSCKNQMAPVPELSVFVSMVSAPVLCFFFITWLRLCFVNTLQQFRHS